MNKHKNTLRLTALALGVMGVVSLAQASGFQIRENSVQALGRANTGSTISKNDAIVAITNPAAMSNFKTTTISFNAVGIDVGGKFNGGGIAGAPFAASTVPPVKALAQPITGNDGGDPGSMQAVPSFAVVVPLHGSFENLSIGFGVNAPFGLVTEWDPNWVGRYSAVKSDVKTIDATLSAAVKLSDHFSVGIGAIFQRAEVTLNNALDLGTAVCGSAGASIAALCLAPTAPYGPQKNDGFLEVTGKDNGIGWTAGLNWNPNERFSFGYNYRSEIRHYLKGGIDFTLPPNVAALPGMTTRFADGGARADLTTPATHTVSMQYAFTPAFRLLGEYQRTNWSSLRDVVIKRDTGVVVGSEDYHWSDTNAYALGAEFDLNSKFTLRGGLGFDETPTHDYNRTPRLPDSDRKLYSIGATWNVNDRLALDAAYMRVQLNDPIINSTSSTGSVLSGRINGGKADVIGLGARFKF